LLQSGVKVLKYPMEKSISKDLQQFMEKFQPSKFKLMANGIEIRGIADIHRTISFAKQLIDRMGLNLKVKHTAEMVGYGAFEVNNA